MIEAGEIKTLVGPSPIEGNGRFALELIPAGYGFGIKLRNVGDTGDVQKDWRQTEFARYINHSPNPNLGQRREGTGIYLYALEDIPKGTELTTDYNDPEAIAQHVPESWDQVASRVAARYATNLRQDRFIDEGMVGEHWGTAASGVLVTDGSRVLLLKRSSEVLDPGLWGIPGGAIPVDHQTGRGKDPKKSAFDEAREEMGGIPSGSLAGKYVFRGNGGLTFTTFVWKVAPEKLDKFKPRLNWEHTNWMLKDINSVGSSGIHPGVVWVLKKMGPVRVASTSGFMSDYKSITHANPMMPNNRVWMGPDPEDPYIYTELGTWAAGIGEDGIMFKSIMSPEKQGAGFASKVIRAITRIADKHEISLHLTPKPFGRMKNKLNKSQLMGWYKRHGWKKEKEYGGMIRRPKGYKTAAPMGDCYDANGQYFMHHALFPGNNEKLRMVHGEVTGQGPLDGVKYGHAWVEDGNTVIDISNGRDVRMSKKRYYKLGHIKENGNTHVYDPEEFRAKVMQYEHWGPWDLRTSSGL